MTREEREELQIKFTVSQGNNHADVISTNPHFRHLWSQKVKILAASGLNAVTAAAAGTTNSQGAPTKIFAVIATNNDTVPHDIQIGITDTGASPVGFTPLGTVTIPSNAGFIGGIPSINLLTAIAALPLDETGQQFVFLNANDLLQVKCLVAVSAGKEVDIEVQGADF
jgi:hypothetical protein